MFVIIIKFKQSHRLSQLCEVLNLKKCLDFKHIIQSHCNMHNFGVYILNYWSCHIPLKFRCLIKKIDHIIRPMKLSSFPNPNILTCNDLKIQIPHGLMKYDQDNAKCMDSHSPRCTDVIYYSFMMCSAIH